MSEREPVVISPAMFFKIVDALWSRGISSDTDCLISIYHPDLEDGTFGFGLMLPNEEEGEQ